MAPPPALAAHRSLCRDTPPFAGSLPPRLASLLLGGEGERGTRRRAPEGGGPRGAPREGGPDQLSPSLPRRPRSPRSAPPALTHLSPARLGGRRGCSSSSPAWLLQGCGCCFCCGCGTNNSSGEHITVQGGSGGSPTTGPYSPACTPGELRRRRLFWAGEAARRGRRC